MDVMFSPVYSILSLHYSDFDFLISLPSQTQKFFSKLTTCDAVSSVTVSLFFKAHFHTAKVKFLILFDGCISLLHCLTIDTLGRLKT